MSHNQPISNKHELYLESGEQFHHVLASILRGAKEKYISVFGLGFLGGFDEGEALVFRPVFEDLLFLLEDLQQLLPRLGLA